MLKPKTPKRGAFDYLLGPIKEETPYAPPPPPPSEPPRRPQQIKVEIIIEDRRGAPAAPRKRSGSLFWWVLAIGLLVALAGHAEEWRSYELGGTVFSESTDGWSGRSYRLGNTVYEEYSKPGERTVRCSSYRLGQTNYTSCGH